MRPYHNYLYFLNLINQYYLFILLIAYLIFLWDCIIIIRESNFKCLMDFNIEQSGYLLVVPIYNYCIFVRIINCNYKFITFIKYLINVFKL